MNIEGIALADFHSVGGLEGGAVVPLAVIAGKDGLRTHIKPDPAILRIATGEADFVVVVGQDLAPIPGGPAFNPGGRPVLGHANANSGPDLTGYRVRDFKQGIPVFCRGALG